MHGTRGMEHDVSHLTSPIFPGLQANSVESGRRTSCEAKVHDVMLARLLALGHQSTRVMSGM